MKGHVIMSQKELVRITIMDQVITKRIKQKHASKELSISVRQVQRLAKKYKREGAKSLIHKSRGKRSNNKISQEKEVKILDIVRKKYSDFGPTFASEKLFEEDEIKISDEKLRQLMIREQLWIPKKIKSKVLYQMRQRRPSEGELVQIDGSPHKWFEDRGDICCLIVYIDDATGKLKELHFCKVETTNDYFITTKSYIKRYGLPRAFYSDRHSIFKINTKEFNSKAIHKNTGLTQFGRSMKDLKIELIKANSPQAKGRVERSNRTLQDRLVKELRLAGISTIKEANKFASKFMEKYNKKFAVIPISSDNAHRPLSLGTDLDIILSKQYACSISKNLTVQYKNKLYQIKTKRPAYTMKKQKATIIEKNTGKIEIIYKERKLEYTIFKKQPKAHTVLSSKELNTFLDNLVQQPAHKNNKYKPSVDHPWRTYNNYDKAKKGHLQTC